MPGILESVSLNNPGSAPDKVEQVLVVDDSRAQRRILAAYLKRWGYSVIEAGSGAEALRLCATHTVDLVVSDWMMPGMTGLEFCEKFRALHRDHYGYFILLTSKSEKGEVAHGLDVGADDFLTKPVAASEFLARIRAGERILRMERELTEKNRLVHQTLSEISTLYDSLDRDLAEARNLQQSLVRDRFRDFGRARISLMLRPAGHVGGDLVGFFPIGDDQIGFFAVDVSGHGVASALMTARLAAYLSGPSPDQNLALHRARDGSVQPRAPSDVAARLNRLCLEDMETELYFTMLLGHLDMRDGVATLTQCGHPHALVQREDGGLRSYGEGGLPIGLIKGAAWQDISVQLMPGDRLFILSDGVTECPDPNGKLLDEEGVFHLLRRNAGLRGNTFFETLVWELTSYCGDKNFPDDISGVLLEYPGKTDVG